MPFSMSATSKELGLPTTSPLPDFPPPALTPLRRPVGESTVGVFVSCGLRLASDPPIGVTNDLTYRLVPRSAPLDDLVFDHETPVRVYAERDLNVAYPRDHLLELERQGMIGRFADETVSIVGSITLYDQLMSETVPRIHEEFVRQEVDLVWLFSFCPQCHRSVALISRGLEARGLPTLTMSTLLETSEAIKAPRTVFLDYPLGCPAGRPEDREDQRRVLRAALDAAPSFGGEWKVHRLPFAYLPDDDRSWEDELKELYRAKYAIVESHVAEHRRQGQSLAGQEREFTLRCAC